MPPALCSQNICWRNLWFRCRAYSFFFSWESNKAQSQKVMNDIWCGQHAITHSLWKKHICLNRIHIMFFFKLCLILLIYFLFSEMHLVQHDRIHTPNTTRHVFWTCYSMFGTRNIHMLFKMECKAGFLNWQWLTNVKHTV